MGLAEKFGAEINSASDFASAEDDASDEIGRPTSSPPVLPPWDSLPTPSVTAADSGKSGNRFGDIGLLWSLRSPTGPS